MPRNTKPSVDEEVECIDLTEYDEMKQYEAVMQKRGAGKEAAQKAKRRYKVVMKPCFEYSLIELETECGADELLEVLQDFSTAYQAIRETVITTDPKELKKKQKEKKAEDKPVEMITPRQKDIMKTYHIPYSDDMTRAEAQKAISDSYAKVKGDK